MAKYYYDPKVFRDNKGNYCVDIYKKSWVNNYFLCTMTNKSYKVLLQNVQTAITVCNEYAKNTNFFRRLLFN